MSHIDQSSIIFTNHPYYIDDDQMRGYASDALQVDEDDLSDDQYHKWLDGQLQLDWDGFYQSLKLYINKNSPFIVQGSIGRWNGTSYGFDIIYNCDQLMEFLEDCVYLTFYDEDNTLNIQGIHHDGAVYLTLYQLTPQGRQYIDENEDHIGQQGYPSIKQFKDTILSNYVKDVHFEW